MSSDPNASVSIVGPEGTPLSFPLAPPIGRFAAFCVDMAIQFVLVFVVLCGLAGAFTVGSSTLGAFGLVLMFGVRHGYFLFFETFLQGATPGKRMLDLRVVARDGGRLRLESIVARNLMRDLEVFVPLVVMTSPEGVTGPAPWTIRTAAGLWALVIGSLPLYTKERARAGDLVGGTVVVAIPRAVRVRDETRVADTTLAFDRDQLAVYGEHELETLAELLRASEQGRATIEDLRLVAETIQRRIGFVGREPTHTPLGFLRDFYKAQRSDLENKLVLGRRKANKNDRPESPKS